MGQADGEGMAALSQKQEVQHLMIVPQAAKSSICRRANRRFTPQSEYSQGRTMRWPQQVVVMLRARLIPAIVTRKWAH